MSVAVDGSPRNEAAEAGVHAQAGTGTNEQEAAAGAGTNAPSTGGTSSVGDTRAGFVIRVRSLAQPDASAHAW